MVVAVVVIDVAVAIVGFVIGVDDTRKGAAEATNQHHGFIQKRRD